MMTNTENEYRGNAAEKLAQLAGKILSRNGDSRLMPDFDEAVIRAQVREIPEITPAQRQEDAELIAGFILAQTPTAFTTSAHKDIGILFDISRLNDEELAEQDLDRDSVTISLEGANNHFFTLQKLERRRPVLAGSDLVNE